MRSAPIPTLTRELAPPVPRALALSNLAIIQPEFDSTAAQTARELKQEAAARAEVEGRLAELARAEGDPPGVALREEVAALRRELGQEKATNGALRKQVSGAAGRLRVVVVAVAALQVKPSG